MVNRDCDSKQNIQTDTAINQAQYLQSLISVMVPDIILVPSVIFYIMTVVGGNHRRQAVLWPYRVMKSERLLE